MIKQASIALLMIALIPYISFSANFSENFNDGDMNGWITLDEPAKLLNDKGPSNWIVMASPVGKGSALNQTSNIWGDPPDVIPLGTFAIYNLAEWINFELKFDVYSLDNDCLGIIWGWKNRTNHYRFITMIDPANPEGAGADKAPWSKIEKRLGDDEPYYNTIGRKGEASYKDNELTDFNLIVKDGKFSVYSKGKLVVEAQDESYSGGKIGFTMIAQQGCFFDNIELTDFGAEVNLKDKLTSTWSLIRSR
ncbi:TPA: hypothetical protein ENS27_08560 [bacterium]|nr:hypothetical protein [bacterium]